MGSSIRRTDLLALSNLRNDGRKPHEIRRMRIRLGALSATTATVGTSGSALVEQGLTTALATVRGPLPCLRRSDELPDRALVDVRLQTAPFASATDRRSSNPQTDRRLVEASAFIQKSMEASLLLHLYPRSRIEIVIVVLADDGGRLPTALNAASLAVLDAGLPVKDLVCACTAGYAPSTDTTLVDLNRREEAPVGGQAAVQLQCAILPHRNRIVLTQCESRLANGIDTLERILEAAMEGCQLMAEIMQAAVRERASTLLAARQGNLSLELALE
jgi:exosome complex component RRP41